MMRKPEQSVIDNTLVDADIIKESRRWLLENQGVKLGKDRYKSPRISSEIADCSMPMTFDSYSYCSLGCLYCFAYFFKSNNPSIKKISLKAVDVDQMLQTMQGKATNKYQQELYNSFYKRKFLLHWGGLADPFCAFEKGNHVGLKLIKGLGEMNYPTLFSFKGNAIFDRPYRQVFEKYADQRNFAFQVSIVTNSDELSRIVEVGVPTTSKRLRAIKMLSDMGYWTILRLRPFMIGISDEGLGELLERAYEAGIRGVSVEFFAMDSRANIGMKKRYDWLADVMGVKNLHQYFHKLSPSERGGYMRLNRLIKEPYMKQIYKFCIERGLDCGVSDPDFKELNTSGSCCGMPDDFPDNRLLENWTHNQLTYHLKEARRHYHKTGECAEFTFDGVYGYEPYLDSRVDDHVGKIGVCTADYKAYTYRLMIQQKWNNLGSPANPRNYLHGKIMPIKTLDKDGNLIYVYQPMDYETRWVEEGIDLTK